MKNEKSLQEAFEQAEEVDPKVAVKRSKCLKDARLYTENAWKAGPKKQYIIGRDINTNNTFKFFIGMTAE